MKQKYFPVYIDLSEKKIVVIGGGTIATRRVQTLQGFAESILVVAPEITEELCAMKNQGKIMWLQENYSPSNLNDADMVIAATNDTAVNRQIKADCETLAKEEGRQILVSVIDDRSLCDFYFPSIVEKDGVVVGINSSGNPAQTKQIRKQIEAILESDSIYK